MKLPYSKILKPLIFISDLLLLNVSLSVACSIETSFTKVNHASSQLLLIIANLSWLVISQFNNTHHVERPWKFKKVVNKTILSLAYHLAIIVAAFYFLNNVNSYFRVITTYSGIFVVALLVSRLVFFVVLEIIKKKGYNSKRISLIGDRDMVNKLYEPLKKHLEYGNEIVHTLADPELNAYTPVDIVNAFRAKKVNEVLICNRFLSSGFVKDLIAECDIYHIQVKIVTDLLMNAKGAEIVKYSNLPVLMLNTKMEEQFKKYVLKRCFDVTFSVSVAIAGFPLFVILIAITKLTSKGPVFYKQQRIGFNEKPFYIYKFRSMHVNAETAGPQLAKDNDPRVTKWGRFMRKTRLDELPQFWNVFKGDMSVVGPRPERMHFIEQIVKQAPDYRKLLTVKPGITSIGQVHYGYASNIDEICDRMVYDLEYIHKVNLNTDMDIILRTIGVMIQGKGK